MNAYIQEKDMSQSEDENPEQEIINEVDALTMEIDKNLSSDLSNPDIFNNYTCPVPAKNGKLHIQNLADNSLSHPLTRSIPQSEDFIISGRYSTKIFHGIMLDTGAAKISTAVHKQAQAYTSEFGGDIDTPTIGSLTAHFGIGKSSSLGTLEINFPIEDLIFHVIDAETPFLLCL
ncbi:hypothetical protein HI914_02501 [Erysiphe necator]|nr:hypothetical protein HI914_02501 [Erysiphe necator]